MLGSGIDPFSATGIFCTQTATAVKLTMNEEGAQIFDHDAHINPLADLSLSTTPSALWIYHFGTFFFLLFH